MHFACLAENLPAISFLQKEGVYLNTLNDDHESEMHSGLRIFDKFMIRQYFLFRRPIKVKVSHSAPTTMWK